METKLIIFKVKVGCKNISNPSEIIQAIEHRFKEYPKTEGYSVTHYVIPDIEWEGVDIELLYPPTDTMQQNKHFLDYLISINAVPEELISSMKAEIK